MEEQQSMNGGNEPVLYEDVLDEDETRLIIDEGCLPSEENHEKYADERKPRLLKLKSKKDVQDTASTYPCPDCGKTFRRKVKLQAHRLTHRSREELECENCGRKFRKVDSLFSHVCSGFGNSYKCSECDEWFRLKRDLVVHRQSHKQVLALDESLDEKDPAEEIDFSSFVASFVKWPVTCIHCGDELVNLQNYNIHMAAHKKGEPCYCFRCKTKFSCKDDFLLHKDLCPIEEIFECTYCSKKFHTEKKLGDHLESHSLETMSCDTCGLRFSNKEKLAFHMKVHNISIFVCAKCKKIFRCNSSLKNHACVPENDEKKLYTLFDDNVGKIMNEHCQDSLSTIEDSDSEDAELCKVLSDSNICKVCRDVFQQREDLTSHLATHFQCAECKKYFKAQTDLDMHRFLLAEEKLYSCCLCEAVVHGKRELECHLSMHLTSEDDLFDDLESEDNIEFLQNITGSVDATESLHSTSVESSLSSVKIHKVTPAGKNALKCLSCGKFVFSHHNLSAHIEPSTVTADSDDEYVYISRLGSPQNKPKRTEETHCSCHYSSGSVLGSLIEQNPGPSTSLSECGDQEAQKIYTTQALLHLNTHKRKNEESVDLKSKLLLSEITKNSSFVLLDASNKTSNNSDVPNCSEASKPEKETNCRVVLNSASLPEKDLSGSASSITDLSTKKDYKNTSDDSKSILPNVELDGRKEATSPKRLGIRVIKLDNSKVEAAPQRTDTKGLVSNSNTGNGNALAKPLRIFVTTSGLLPLPTSNVGKELGLVSELPIGDKKKSTSGQNNLGFRKILPKVNIVSQDQLVLPPLKKEDNGKSLTNSSGSGPKIIFKKSFKKMSFSELKSVKKIEMVSSKQYKKALKTSNRKLINFETESHNIVRERNKTVGLQALDPFCAISEAKANLIRKPKTLGKTQPVVLKVNDKNSKSGKRRTQLKNREHQEKKISSSSSTLNANDNESCNPEANMILKVEKLSYEPDEDDEGESLDFSGIKKEFLASDVFIKEEWDIVDF